MKLLLLCACLAVLTPTHAAVKLPSIFTDHMVLQRDLPVPVWGKATPGEDVTVEFAGQKKSTKADPSGRWMVKLDPLTANAEPQSLKAGNVTIQDVLVGEVWLASGQSNMEWEMQMKPDTAADIPNATHPNLRLIEVPKTVALSPQDEVPIAWARSTPESAASFSAIGYYFGLRLQEELKVPVGIILSAWGGTRIEPWTSIEGFDAVPALKDFTSDVRSKLPGSDAYRSTNEAYLTAIETWTQAARTALAQKQVVPPMPAQPASLPLNQGTPTSLYNAMIHPLVPFAFRGAIWYQGESNHNEGFAYTEKTKALLASWRSVFQQPDLPFYFVQIAPWQYGAEDVEILPQFWQAQRECLNIPHTGMATISDIGEIPDIHPAHKKEVARRLSLWALAKNYGHSEIDPNGPLYASHATEGSAIRVKFDHAANGLASRDGKPLTHFEIAGKDGIFHPAEAKTDGSSILISAATVPEPRRARFAWSKLAIANLMNKDGLPATAFHTHWPVDTDLGDNLAYGCTWESSDKNTYGWDTGLTDGSLMESPPNCYATSNSDTFPKHVTIDLKQAKPINLVRVSVPNVGSTKTVAVSISTDGKTFHEVGKHVFSLAKTESAGLTFPDAEARYIRITYLDHHDKLSGEYPNTFAFTTEVEAYLTK
ncbi:MAG: discoidin domain-containing protein [Prosthecobacter sp.]|uniref:sialate O-acetylesterase n=1 Tax=Prosthecobacter sp. TaxID=1965333 RepID=UPI002635C243|nr:sialate O-acetylesterase [Prosthecobacter sp.]MCF7790004.1 discoidin domain-containing protein [Prosthecobacter sp.]